MNYGFDTIPNRDLNIVDSSNFVLAQFNENYCTRIEYHITFGEYSNSCDSIFCTSACDSCFNITLDAFLSQNNWKQNSENEFYSLRNHGKWVRYDTSRNVDFNIKKLEVISPKDGNVSFIVNRVYVPKSEYKRLKKIKRYGK